MTVDGQIWSASVEIYSSGGLRREAGNRSRILMEDFADEDREMELGLEGRVALVTGDCNGIGRASAEMFAAEGARVLLTHFRNVREAEQIVEGIPRSGGEAMLARLDLADPDSIHDAVSVATGHWGRLDVLVTSV